MKNKSKNSQMILMTVLVMLLTLCMLGNLIRKMWSTPFDQADNYVLIVPYDIDTYSLWDSFFGAEAVDVKVYEEESKEEVDAPVEFLERYNQYAVLLEKGSYIVKVFYSDSTVKRCKLNVVQGQEFYVLVFNSIKAI